MNKVLGGAAVLAISSGAAFAADLPARRAPLAPPPIVLPAFSWTGFYFGGTAGYAFDSAGSYNLIPNTGAQAVSIANSTRPSFLITRGTGFTGGGTIGYNVQLGHPIAAFGLFGGALNKGLDDVLGSGGATGGFVAGIEADAAYTGVKRTADFIGITGVDNNFASNTQFVGTVRGRVGYAFGNLLIFGTGGFAYGGIDDRVLLFSGRNLANGNYAGATSSIRTGVSYGGGAEYAIPTTSMINVFKSSAVTVKFEFIRYDLGAENVPLPNISGGNGTPFTTRVRTDGDLVRAGLNYKIDFNPTSVPVVARY